MYNFGFYINQPHSFLRGGRTRQRSGVLCIQKLLLAVLGGHMGCRRLDAGWPPAKQNDPPAELSLWPPFLFLKNEQKAQWSFGFSFYFLVFFF